MYTKNEKSYQSMRAPKRRHEQTDDSLSTSNDETDLRWEYFTPKKPYLKMPKSKSSNKDQKRFNTSFFQHLATHPIHSPLTLNTKQSGYFRSSEQGAYFNYQSAPVLPGVRSDKVIGGRHNTNKLKGLDFTHEGLNLHLSQQNDILYKKHTGSDLTAEEELLTSLVGENFAKSRLKKKMEEKLAGNSDDLEELDELDNEYQSSMNLISGSKIKPSSSMKMIALQHNLTEARIKDLNETCEIILNKTNDLKYVKLFHNNKYPCLGVLFATPRKQIEDGKAELWMQVMMSLFLGLCNSNTDAYGSMQPVTTYVKSSFGHMETTLADCYEVMRINVGHITENQADFLSSKLRELDGILSVIFEERAPEEKEYKNEIHLEVNIEDSFSIFNDRINDKTKSPSKNTSPAAINLGKNGLYHLYGQRLNDLILSSNSQVLDREKLVGLLNDNTITIENKCLKDIERVPYENHMLIEKISEIYGINFDGINGDEIKYPTIYQTIRETIGARIFNETIADKDAVEENSYGSDSEIEEDLDEENTKKIHARKYVLPFGMRAIGVAIELSRLLSGSNGKVTIDKMYYESEEIKQTFYAPKNQLGKRNKNIKMIDANHLINNYSDYKKEKERPNSNKVHIEECCNAHIVDVTGADTETIGHILRKRLIDNNHTFVILVSSMTKFEFGGTDTIGCGMLRLFTRDKTQLNNASTYIEARARSKTSGFVNMMRRGYKNSLGQKTNAELLKAMNSDLEQSRLDG